MKQEYVLLAQDYKTGKHNVSGWFLSEKLDGKRAFWDGGVSRGCLATEVPWSNTVKDKRPFTATGLWTRYGKVIHAPDWWLNTLPKIPLDGELWTGRGSFQEVTSITAKHEPIDEEWKTVEYHVFDSPWFLIDRKIKVRDYEFEIKGAQEWAAARDGLGVTYPKTNWNFELIQTFLTGRVQWPHATIIAQQRIPYLHAEAVTFIQTELDRIVSEGGEGLMLRKPESFWRPERSHLLLKVKPWKIGQGIVVGYQHAELGKIEGLMGSLILDVDGKRLKISGFTDAERIYGNPASYKQAMSRPGCEASSDVFHKKFPRGRTIKFKYRELSDDGIPKDARYLR